jgi:Bacterial protein of unknown function (DUF839)
MLDISRRVIAVAASLTVAGAGIVASGEGASAFSELRWTPVPANGDTRGVAVPNSLAPQLAEQVRAQGSQRLENATAAVPYYGYDGNGTLVPDPANSLAEASKTEPDKNTYLRLPGLHGADPGYRYGTHFLFQGHEGGTTGYLTRINLDADGPHRVTLLASTLADGRAMPTIDGSTWDPWTKHLLLTAEGGPQGGVYQATPDINAKVEDLAAVLGRGGYEGIQNDSAGRLWIVEDSGGATPTGSKAKNPNSFVYRFTPYDRTDLTKGGRLQALQVLSRRTGRPITFQPLDAAHPTGGIFTPDQKDLSSYGVEFETRWVTVHDTHVDSGAAAYDANAAAKTAGATPFKRPENGVFRPGSRFGQFFFTVTGDTNTTSDANAEYGGWGALMQLSQADPGSDHGRLQVFYRGDQAHTGLDNITFIDRDHLASVEDASDTVHAQRNAFDSGYLFDLRTSYARGAAPVRFLAEGRDEAATEDNMLGALGNGFQNEGDNEITGIHMSDGDPSPAGILGAKLPRPFSDGWRLFWTQQHGQNITWEILPANR